MEYYCFIDYFIQLVKVRAHDSGTCHISVSVGVKVTHAHRTLQKPNRELPSMEAGFEAWENEHQHHPTCREREDLTWQVLGHFGSARWFEPTAPLSIWAQGLEPQYRGAPLVTLTSPRILGFALRVRPSGDWSG